MPNLTDYDRGAVFYNAGFRGEDLVDMIATSIAENVDGDPFLQSQIPKVGGPNGLENSWGIAQINLDVHPLTLAQAQNPVTSAQYAYQLFTTRHGFTDWAGYTSGNYLHFKDRAYTAAATVVQNVGMLPTAVAGILSSFFGNNQAGSPNSGPITNPNDPIPNPPPQTGPGMPNPITNIFGIPIYDPFRPLTGPQPNSVQGAVDTAVSSAVAPLVKPFTDIGTFFTNAGKFLFSGATWMRIGLLMLAMFMIIGGVIIYVTGDNESSTQPVME